MQKQKRTDRDHAPHLARSFAEAAVQAINEHKVRGIGTRPMQQWDDHDVIDSGIILPALADNGLGSHLRNEYRLENKVSPVVFKQACEENDPRLQEAVKALAAGGAFIGEHGIWQVGPTAS
jgi:hypothetical protein